MSTILVVDDMAVFREPIIASLQMRGFDTHSACDGREALEVMREKAPDLILLDLAMPHLDGIQVLRAMKSDPRLASIPVIMLTAISDRTTIIEAGRLGVRDYLLKSHFSLDEMMRRINRHLDDAEDAAGAAAGSGTVSPARGAVDHDTASNDGGRMDDDRKNVAAESAEDAPTDLRELKPIATRSEIQDMLASCTEIKALSPSVMKVLQLTSSQKCSIDDVARAVKQDHAIALKILKLANSTVYTRGEPVESVQKAVARIGMTQINQAVMNIGVIDQFSGKDSQSASRASLFWEHSIAVGLIASEITRARGGKESDIDSAFTAGLLHDVGRMVYREVLGETYAHVEQIAEQLALPLEVVESRMLLIDHAAAMDRVLHAWRFPKDLINPIAMHQMSAGNIRRLVPRDIERCCTMSLANRLAHALLLGSSGNLAIYPTSELIEALRVSPDLIASIEENMPEQTTDLKFAMLSRTAQTDVPSVREALLERIGWTVRPAFVGESPQTDAIRIFAARLRSEATDEPPNVLFVHIRATRDQAAVSALLREFDQQNDSPKIPIILFSPKGNLQLEDSARKGRTVLNMTSMFTLTALERVLRTTAESDVAKAA